MFAKIEEESKVYKGYNKVSETRNSEPLFIKMFTVNTLKEIKLQRDFFLINRLRNKILLTQAFYKNKFV